MRDMHKHIIHCTASPDDMDIGAKEIREWHTSPDKNDSSKPWSDIGYHFVIRRDGLLEGGRPLSRMGAHAKGFNKHSIGTVLVGNDSFTAMQFKTLYWLHNVLMQAFPGITYHPHNEFNANKTCPNFDPRPILEDLYKDMPRG